MDVSSVIHFNLLESNHQSNKDLSNLVMDRFNDYLSNHYLENFPHSNEFNHHRIVNGKTFYPLLQIQKYDQNSGHYNTWHTEKEDLNTANRMFVFIFYLNDVEEGGETGFLFKDKIEQAFEETDDDGRTSMVPISFDYRVSNLCNFKCRTCGEPLSSSWEAEKRKHGLWNSTNQPFMVPENKAIIDRFQKEVVEEEFWEYICSGTVEELYWVGGEPLMYDIHWRAMDRLAQDDNLKKVHLRYNSNLSRVRLGKHYLYDWLPQAKDWTMCASIDGTHEIGEYIRSGLVWKKFEENFEHGMKFQNGRNKRLNLDFTITTPGLFEIENMFELSLKHDVTIITKQTFAFSPEVFMSVKVIPHRILDRIVTEILGRIEPRATDKQQGMIDILKQFITQKNYHEQFQNYQEGTKEGKQFIDQMESRRTKIHHIENNKIKKVYFIQ